MIYGVGRVVLPVQRQTSMRLRSTVPLLTVLLFASAGCDLVSDVDGPRPEDFELHEDTSEARASEDADVGDGTTRQERSSPLAAARSGATLSIRAAQTAP